RRTQFHRRHSSIRVARPGSSELRMRIIVAITGATGSIIGVRILAALRELGVETHLVLSRWGRATLEMETSLSASDVYALADHVHGQADHSAAIASGSFRTDGM